MNTVEDFMDRCVEVGDCLVWRGGHNSKGTPVCRYQGKPASVRRVLWCLHRGKPIASLGSRLVWSHCGTDDCVSPDHFRCTDKSVMWKWRQAEGLTVFSAGHQAALTASARRRSGTKLTMDAARAMRDLREREGLTLEAIGTRFGVSIDTVWRVVTQTRWREAVTGASVFHQFPGERAKGESTSSLPPPSAPPRGRPLSSPATT